MRVEKDWECRIFQIEAYVPKTLPGFLLAQNSPHPHGEPVEPRGAPMEVKVYIVKCSNGSYYTGLTRQEIDARVWEHDEGVCRGYTFTRRPVKLVFTETYDRIVDAIARERQIKGWTRAKKEALIALDYEALPELSRNQQDRGLPRGSTGSP